MKIFRFVKKSFFVGLTISIRFDKRKLLKLYFNEQSSAKQDHRLLMLMEMNLCFFHLVLKQVNVVVVVIILTIRMQKFVFLML